MGFELDEVIGDMAEAIKGSIKEDWPAARDTIGQFLYRRKDRILLIAELILKGTLTLESAKPYLEIERQLLEMEILGVSIITKSAAQNAANKAITVLVEAIKTVIL